LIPLAFAMDYTPLKNHTDDETFAPFMLFAYVMVVFIPSILYCSFRKTDTNKIEYDDSKTKEQKE